MHNEFIAIIERDDEWYIATAPRSQEQTARAGPRMKLDRAWPRPSRLSLRTGGKMACAGCHQTPYVRPSWSREAEQP